jgi:hypothetical protein
MRKARTILNQKVRNENNSGRDLIPLPNAVSAAGAAVSTRHGLLALLGAGELGRAHVLDL